MPPKLELARAWLVKAAHDLEMADRALAEPAFPDMASFHAQQAIEKALKAVLVIREVEPPRTHLLSVLLDQMEPLDDRLANLRNQLNWLTAFAVEARYPNVEDEPSTAQAREAVSIARRGFDVILESIPPGARP